MREVDFPIERDPADAWADFAGCGVNYEQAAYAVAAAVDAVPALWSGPRRRGRPAIPPSAHLSDGRPNKLRRRDHMRARGGMAGRATTAGHLAADTPREQASPRAGSAGTRPACGATGDHKTRLPCLDGMARCGAGNWSRW